MVKFSKELEAQAQLIPEWKDAFLNYRNLKKYIKKIKLAKHETLTEVKSEMIIVGHQKEVDDEANETELVQQFREEHEMKMFYEMIDNELNKVNQFYIAKENEFHERGEILNKQLLILLDLKRDLNRADWNSPINLQKDKNVVKAAKSKATQTIAYVMSMLWEDLFNNRKEEEEGENNSRKKIQCAEKMITEAFVELYRGLALLKTYSSVNQMAFRKILKKFDKVTNQQASSTSYLKVMKQSYFTNSDTVTRIMNEVESLYTKHLAKNDKKKAMEFLRPQPRKHTHILTFFVGLFTGSFVTLFIVYGILAYLSGLFSASAKPSYIETVYPLFSIFALLSLHLFMYGCNLFMWKKTRINYNFIFEFQPNKALKYWDAFLICTTLMTAVVCTMTIHLILRSTGFSPHQVDLIPGILLLCSILILICPLNFFYRSTRYSFLKVVRNIVCSPFYKVMMVDFFMADQLTSQIPLLRHMESATCYFLAGSFEMETCKSGVMYKELAYVISFAPYYWRAMQCARRWYDECNIDHLANLGKYVSAMVAAGARLTYTRHPSQLWMVVALMTSLVATIYQLYWDFVKDWGLLNPNSKNPWLRDALMLKNKGIYYASIALNFILRVAWVETVMQLNTGMLESRMLNFFLASLEVIRRGHWNYYRLENEHMNNVEKFRAVKIVQLPFHETN